MEVWKHCSKALIADDMKIADEEKKKVEADQRVREAKRKADVLSSLISFNVVISIHFQGLMDEGTYFVKDKNSLDGDWEFRDNIDLVTLFGGYVPSYVRYILFID